MLMLSHGVTEILRPPSQQNLEIVVAVTCTTGCRWELEAPGCTLERLGAENATRITRTGRDTCTWVHVHLFRVSVPRQVRDPDVGALARSSPVWLFEHERRALCGVALLS